MALVLDGYNPITLMYQIYPSAILTGMGVTNLSYMCKCAKNTLSRREHLNIHFYEIWPSAKETISRSECLKFVYSLWTNAKEVISWPESSWKSMFLKKVPRKQYQGQSIWIFTFSPLRNMTKCKRGNIRTRCLKFVYSFL